MSCQLHHQIFLFKSKSDVFLHCPCPLSVTFTALCTCKSTHICVWSWRNLSAHMSGTMAQSFSWSSSWQSWKKMIDGRLRKKVSCEWKNDDMFRNLLSVLTFDLAFFVEADHCLAKICAEMRGETERGFIYVYFQTSFKCDDFYTVYNLYIFFFLTYNASVNIISV